nr:hypothetical protein [Streptomyces sp. TRM72054]
MGTHVLRVVEVQSAATHFDVHDRHGVHGFAFVVPPQDHEVTGSRGMSAGAERQDLNVDVRTLGHVEEMLELPRHDSRVTHCAAQDRLVQDHPQMQGRVPSQDVLALDACFQYRAQAVGSPV